MFLLALLLTLFVSTSALTCQVAGGDHCLAVGCNEHCEALGKKGGYCLWQLNNQSKVNDGECTCECVSTSELECCKFLSGFYPTVANSCDHCMTCIANHEGNSYQTDMLPYSVEAESYWDCGGSGCQMFAEKRC